jgi:hypothetical protein
MVKKLYPKLYPGREVLDGLAKLLLDGFAARRVRGEVNVRRRDQAFLALHGTYDQLRELGTSVSHGQSGRASAVLGLDDLVTAKLDPVNESFELVLCKVGREGVRRLRQKGHDLYFCLSRCPSHKET